MSDPKHIYLGPACQKDGDGREWCEDDVWPECECGCSSVKYMLESDALSQLAALREELAKAKEWASQYAELEDIFHSERDIWQRESHANSRAHGETQQRLADAERRNGELIDAMERIHFRCESFSDEALGMQKHSVRVMLDIAAKALTKPEEAKL